MKLTDKIYFYEGDYISGTRFIYDGLGSSNFMVINGRDQVMIDSGMTRGPHMRRIRRELRADGINLFNTKKVLLSHTHPDHFLHAKKIAKKNPLSFIVHHDSEPMVRRCSFQFEACYNFPLFIQKEIFDWPVWIARLVLNRYFGFDYLRIQHMLQSNDKIDIGVSAEVVHLPSHFPGHIGLYFNEQKIFYSADLFDFRVSEGGIINNALSSYEQVFRDIDKIRELDIEVIVPGHGRVIRGKNMIKTTLDRVQRGTEEYSVNTIKLLKSSGVKGITLKEIVYSFFSGMNTYNLVARKIIIYNTLMHLRTNGIAEFTIRSGRAYWKLL